MNRPPIHPHVWNPPPAPPRSRQRTSHRPLAPIELIPLPGIGPEDIAIDPAGRIISGVEDGRILRVTRERASVETLTTVPGRPLGIELFSDGRLLVCSAGVGLLLVDPDTGAVETLVSEVHGVPVRVCNNAAIEPDGTTWFTDSSSRFDLADWPADFLEHSRTGRLLRRSVDGDLEVVVDGLAFPNGVAVAPDGTSVVVVEGGRYRLLRVWLTGARSGKVDTLIDNMPAVADNLTTGSDGLIWVGCITSRNRMLDHLLALPPALRKAVWAMPAWLQPAPRATAWVMAIDSIGRIVYDLQAEHPQLSMVTTALEEAGSLYLGCLTRNVVGVIQNIHASS